MHDYKKPTYNLQEMYMAAALLTQYLKARKT